MRKRSVYCVLGVAVAVASVLLWLVVHWTYICGLRVKQDIQKSPFSKELRRVGVKVPAERNWKTTSTKVLSGRTVATRNLELSGQCDAVLTILNSHKASDAERLVLLPEALGILKTGDTNEMNEFLKRLAGKHDWESGRNPMVIPIGGKPGSSI